MADQSNFFGERAGQSSLQWDYKSHAQSSSPYHLDLSKDKEPSTTPESPDNFQSTSQPTVPVPVFLGQFISRLWNSEESLKLRAAGTAAAKTVFGEARGEALAETVGSAVESAMFFDGSSAPSLGDLYAHQVKYSSIVFLPDAEQDNRIQAYAYYNPLTPYFSGLTSEYPSSDSLLFANLEPSYLAQSGDAAEEASEYLVAETTATPQESVVVAAATAQTRTYDTADSSYSYTYDYVPDSVSSVSTPRWSTTTGEATILSQTAISVLALDYNLLTISDDSVGVAKTVVSSAANYESQSVVAEDLEESVAEEAPSAAQPLESPLESAADQDVLTWLDTSQAQQDFSQESELDSNQTGSDLLARSEVLASLSQSGASVEHGAFSENVKANEEINSHQAKDSLVSSGMPEGFVKKSRRGRDSLLDHDVNFESAAASLSPHLAQSQSQIATDSGNSFATRDNARFINASALMGMRRPAERSEADLSLDEAALIRTMDHRLSAVSSSDHAGSGHGDSQQQPDWSLLAQDSASLDSEARPESKTPLYAEDLEDLPNPLVITDSVIV